MMADIECPPPLFKIFGSATECIYLFIQLYIYLFVFPGLVTLSTTRTKKLHCRRNITSYYDMKYEYCHKTILSGAGKKKQKYVLR